MDMDTITERWLEDKFDAITKDIQALRREQETVARILMEGNGQKPLTTEVALNSAFREDQVERLRGLTRARYALYGSAVVLVISTILQFTFH